MLQLTIRFDDERQTQVFAIDGETTIGCHSDNSLPIKATFLSAFHAEIKRSSQGGYQVNDLDSLNGTFVNGLRISQHPLRAGDELMLGSLFGKVTERGTGADFSESCANEKAKAQATIVALNGRDTSPQQAPRETKAPSANGARKPASARTQVAARALRPATQSLPVAKVEKNSQNSHVRTQQYDLFAVDQVELAKLRDRVAYLEKNNARFAKAAENETQKKLISAEKERDEKSAQIKTLISRLDDTETARATEIELRQQLETLNQQCDSRSTEIAEQVAASVTLAASLARAKKATAERDQQIVQLGAEISAFEQLEKSHRAELAERDDEISDLEGSLLKVRAASDESSAIEAELREQLVIAAAERDTLRQQLGDGCERVAELEADMVRSNTGAEQLKAEASALGEQIEQLTADRSRTLSELADAQQQIERWQAKLGERDDNLAAADQKNRAACKQIAELASDLADAERARADLDATRAKLASDIAAAETDLAKREAAFQGAEQRVQKIESERDAIAVELEQLRAVHKDVAAAESHIEEVRQRAERIDFDVDSQRTVLARARQALKDLEATAATVRADLESEQKRLRDEISTTRDSLDALSAKHTLAETEHRQRSDQLEADGEALAERLHLRRAELAAAEQQRSEIDKRAKRAERELQDMVARGEQIGQRTAQADRALHKAEHKLARRSNLLEQLRGLRLRERALRQQEKQLGSDLGSASASAALDQSLEKKQKAHAKTSAGMQRKLRTTEKALDKKLRELRLADDRIRFSEQLDRDVAARQRELAEITGQFDAATQAVRHLQQERQNLSTIIDQLDLDLTSRGDDAASERHGNGNRNGRRKGIGLSSARSSRTVSSPAPS